jgi:hypothetical protein
MGETRGILPVVLAGLLLGLVLIYIGTGGNTGANPVLIQQFSPRPTLPGEPTAGSLDLPQVDLPALPPDVQRAVTEIGERIAGELPSPALTPVATSARARVEVREVRRSGGRIRVQGAVANTSGQALTIPPGAFSFRDSDGTSYATSGTASVTLQPGETTTFDLTVPLPPDRGLALILTLPPDLPITQDLFVAIGR